MVLFILFTPLGQSKNIWYKDDKNNKTDFIEKLERLGKIHINVPIFSNYLQFDETKNGRDFDKEYKFDLEDIKFKNYCEKLYGQLRTSGELFIPIGLEDGCHYAFYFANKYYKECAGLFLIGNRRFTKENYLKSVERGARMMEKEYGDGYQEFIDKNVTNDNLHELLNRLKNKPNKKYLAMVGYYVGLTLRSQYDDLPTECKIPTFIYNRITLSRDIMLQHNLKDVQTKYIKNIHSETEAIMAHCTTNMDKYEADQELIKHSAKEMIKTYYIKNENFNLFIFGDIKDDIIEKIESFINKYKIKQGGVCNYNDKYNKYKTKYMQLKKYSVMARQKGGANKTIIDFKVNPLCMESYPCKHKIILYYEDGTNEHSIYNGPQIYNLYKSLNRPMDPHFSIYSDDKFNNYK